MLSACLAIHLFLIFAVSCRETSWLLARRLTVLPSSFKAIGEQGEKISSGALGSALTRANPLRQAITSYTHVAGIEGGYGFFAPNIPDSFTLVFEIHYSDERVEYELPQVGSVAADLRVAGLLDKLGRREYDPLREGLVKMLAHSIWRAHPDAKMIRAVFGSINLPGMVEFEEGRKPTFQFLCAYDFTLNAKPAEPDAP
jgi:hypothetical protein